MGLGYYINKAILGIKKNGALVSPDENGIVDLGESGATDYADLDNKPKIDGVELVGDKSAEELSLSKFVYLEDDMVASEMLFRIAKCAAPDSKQKNTIYYHYDAYFIPCIFFYYNPSNEEAVLRFYSAKSYKIIIVSIAGGGVTISNDDNLPSPGQIGAATSAQGAKADSAIQEVKVNGTPLIPDANKSVNIVMSGSGSGESNVIETVKVNGTPLVPDANKAVDVITVNYITQDMTAAEILEVAARCADENGALKEPMYFNDPTSFGFVPCTGLSYDSTSNSAGIYFYYAAGYWTIEVQVDSGEVTIEKWQNAPTPQNIGAAEAIHTHSQGDIANLIGTLSLKAPLNHDHAGVYQPVESGKGLSTNDLTNALKTNYDTAYTHSQAIHAPSDAQENVIETVKVNGNALTVTNKAVDIVEPQWRTLNNITVGTAATLFSYTADSDNVPYNLQAIRVKVMVASGAPADGNINIKPSFDTDFVDVMQPYFGRGVITDKTMYTALEAVRNNGLFDAIWLLPREEDSGTSTNLLSNISLRGRKATNGTNTLKRVNITCSATTNIPVGSTILIEGIDA